MRHLAQQLDARHPCKNWDNQVSILSNGSFIFPRTEEKILANRAWILLSVAVSLSIAVAIVMGCLKLPWEFVFCLAFAVVITADTIERHAQDYLKFSSLITVSFVLGLALRITRTLFLK